MRRRTVTIGAMAGAMAVLGVAAAAPNLGAQQQVQVIVTAVPNPVPAGSCTGIWVEVRDAANQRLNDLNGVPLHSRSYDYSIPNTPGFAWRDNDPGSGYLCAQVGVATVNIPVTATVRSTSYSGATIVTIQSGAPGQVAAANPPAGAGNPAGAAGGAAQPGYAQPAGAAPAGAGYAPAAGAAQPAYGQPAGQPVGQPAGAAPAGAGYAPAAGAAQPAYGQPAGQPVGQPAGAAPAAGGAPAGGVAGAAQPAYGQPAGAAPSGAAGAAQPGGDPQQAGYAPPPATANPYTPPQAPVPGQPYASQPSEASPQAQPVAAAVQPVAAAPAEKKGGGGFFKKFGKHIKQKASEVTSQTAQNLASSATQLVDTTLQTGSGLVSGTVAGAGNTARSTIGGAGKSLLPSALRGGAETSDNLASAVASGRAVLRAMRFTAGTAVLEPSSQELAVRLAGELKKVLLTSPGIFLIAVHVDPILTPAGAPIPSASQQLSEQRAGTVKAVLVRNGVLPTQLIALGYGASQPMPETAPDGSSSSARVEIARTQ